jgi:hypothetical protein
MAKKSGKLATPKSKKNPPKQSRHLRLGSYQNFKLSKPIKHPGSLPNVWQLTKLAWQTLWRHKELFVGITIIYGLLNLLLVQGLASGTDVSSLKAALNQHLRGAG